jgi:hypothetical protein
MVYILVALVGEDWNSISSVCEAEWRIVDKKDLTDVPVFEDP